MLYLLSGACDYTLLWVFETFEGGDNTDLPKITRMMRRLAELSEYPWGATLELLDRDREVMIAKVYAPLPRIVEYLKACGSECQPTADDA